MPSYLNYPILPTFICISRLLGATSTHEDAVTLLQAAARDYVPVDPNNKAALANTSSLWGSPRDVPEPGKRPTIEFIIDEIRGQEWYSDQISYVRTIPAKDGQSGRLFQIARYSI
jgi:DEAD/DEAH box helicase domain-containing protein